MANEISVSVSLSAIKNGVQVANSFSRQADMSGNEMLGAVQAVGTNAETLNLGDVSTIGYLLVKNMDETNYVEIDSAAAMDNFPQKMLAGDFILLKPQTTTIYVKANTASCNLWVQPIEL